MAGETPTARILRELELLKVSVQSLDKDQQQRLALVEERINGRLALLEQSLVAMTARLGNLEGGRQWVLRTVGGVAIGAVVTTVWALGGLHH